MSEHEEQAIVIKFCDWKKIPVFSIPNGFFLKDRKTVFKILSKMKKEGLRSGVPDIFIPVAAQGYHGLFIEMKTERGRVKEEQKKWILTLQENGFAVFVCRGSENAIDVIKHYLPMEGAFYE